MEGVDILGGLDNIQQKLVNDEYAGELAFQLDIAALIFSARDGHFVFQPDLLSIFAFERTIGGLLSVSLDGESPPEIYSYDDISASRNASLDWQPSAIVSIDGEPVLDWLDFQAQNTTGLNQDPDTNWNALFNEIANSPGAVVGAMNAFPGVSNNYTFANGTSRVFPIVGIAQQDFDGVFDGPSFYQKFCNATVKMEAAATTTSSQPVRTQSPRRPESTADEALLGYPDPFITDEDGTLAGFFLDTDGFRDTAVLAVKSFEPTNDDSFIDTMKKFLEECRRRRSSHLIVDVSSNGGGNILLAVDTFKQLFPTVDPYHTFSFRATDQLEVLMNFYTSLAAELQDSSEQTFANAGGDSDYDASPLLDAAGQGYDNFENYWRPFEVHNDSFTPLARYNLSNVEESDIVDGIVVSGYGNNRDIAPQHFASENVTMVTDGQCASSCHTFSHLMKWQGKVKTVAFGGRPQTAGQPMQYVGGVKGSEIVYLGNLLPFVSMLYGNAPSEVIEAADKTGLKTLHELGNYTLYRSADPVSSTFASINYQNFIGQFDSSYTPMQFVYEAADCRLWYSVDMAFDITTIWQRAASEAFAIGPNSTDVFAGCLEGSTNAPSSLSGNATLFDNGNVANVTQFIPSTLNATTEDAADDSSSTDAPAENSALDAVRQTAYSSFRGFGVLIIVSLLVL
ncbi:hypothetical protein, variant [Exophiala mesophila]|nr:hypothetical protein, variant [Exophiala mesophila]KIV95950.1 hypothetical protein, variant [Exophiala mesophila]